LGLGSAWIASEVEQVRFQTAHAEAVDKVYMLHGEHDTSSYYEGRLVYVNSTSPVVPTTPPVDVDFNLRFPAGVRVQRSTEYCQWQEFSHESEDEDGNKARTYSYILGWHSMPIPSFYFDQPFAHNNPQRDPAPATEWVADAAKMGSFTLDKTLLQYAQPLEAADFAANGPALQQFSQSVAARQHGFKYIGQGYFYSPYQADATEWLRIAGMALEGSLLDYQLGDLFKRCTPGDVRVSYSQVALPTASVIAEHYPGSRLGLHKTSNQYELGLVHKGLLTPNELFAVRMSQNFWTSFWWRLGCLAVFTMFVFISTGWKFWTALFTVVSSMGIIAALVRVTLAVSATKPISLIVLAAATLYLLHGKPVLKRE
jgi:hypothetical protein